MKGTIIINNQLCKMRLKDSMDKKKAAHKQMEVNQNNRNHKNYRS